MKVWKGVFKIQGRDMRKPILDWIQGLDRDPLKMITMLPDGF